MNLTSLVDGTVQQLTVYTVGGVVPRAAFMKYPHGRSHVQIEATVEDKDIGFIKEGQHAEVKIDAYEYTKYGTIPGVVTHISRRDAMPGRQERIALFG